MLCISTKWCLNILTSQQSLLLPLPTLSGMDCSAKVASHSSMRRVQILSVLSRKESVKIQEVKFLPQTLEFKPKYSPLWTMRITTILILLKACSLTSIGDLDRVSVLCCYARYWSYFLSCSKILTCCDHFLIIITWKMSPSILDPVLEMGLMTELTDHCPVILSHLSRGRWTASVSSSPLPRWISSALTSSVVLECVGVMRRELARPVSSSPRNISLLLITKTTPRMDRLAATRTQGPTEVEELLSRLSFPMTSVISTATAPGSNDNWGGLFCLEVYVWQGACWQNKSFVNHHLTE